VTGAKGVPEAEVDGEPRRQLPSTERVLQHLAAEGALDGRPRRLAVACVREAVDRARAALRDGRAVSVGVEEVADAARALLAQRAAPTLVPAVNATGIIVHTNLGRAPLCEDALKAVEAASGYAVLEIDPDSGSRGSRQRHVDALLCELTGAEAGCAVNNNAAAVFVALAALAAGRQVVVSRGELVEIGGSFRIPDIMAAAGCRLVEVGTTNKTYLRDYETALRPETALLVKVHRSNFAMRGFVHEVALAELAALSARSGVPLLFDMGSGALVDLRTRGLPPEPTASEAIAAGADVVTFSGDKLLGGPQAGLIVGREGLLRRIKGHPAARAVRIDKLDLAALEATLRVSRDPERAWDRIPVLRMLGADLGALEAAAADLARRLRARVGAAAAVEVSRTTVEAGGGALPGVELPSWAVALAPRCGGPDAWEQRLRRHRPPVFCRIAGDRLLLDLRTLAPRDLPVVEAAVAAAAADLTRAAEARPER
jgi:L-seryl-tRNA(Ser) seleniumtransferase